MNERWQIDRGRSLAAGAGGPPLWALAAALWWGLAGGAANAAPILSELYYDASGTDDGQLFVELYGAPGAILDGMTVEGVNGAGGAVGPVVTLSGVIPADGLFVVADRMSDGTTLVMGADQLANFDFQNGPDSVQLKLADTVLDAIGYGDFAPGDVFAGEGASAPDPPAGSSLARVFADVDTDDNAADFEVLATPTPGFAPVSGLPEPGAPVLMGLGLAGLWVTGSRKR